VNKLVATAVLALTSLMTVHYVSGANAPDLPKGVGANNWIPVSGRLGFVMEPTIVNPGADCVSSLQLIFYRAPRCEYISLARTR
jgi:hypothetical protein